MEIVLKITSTLPQVIAVVMYVGQVNPATLPLFIMENMLKYVDLGQKRQTTLPLAMVEHDFMLKGEMDIGLQKEAIAPLTKANVVDC